MIFANSILHFLQKTHKKGRKSISPYAKKAVILSSNLEINDFVALQLIKLSQILLSPKIKIFGAP